MSEKKKIDTMAILERSKKAKEKPRSKALDKKLGKGKNKAKFNKVNFNG
ncbi:MAG: hypothetical protein RSC10_07175 [Longicatena sp.]